MSDSFQVFFRTTKGGCGIEYETARAEFMSVFRDYQVDVLHELPFKMRIHVAIPDLSDDKISSLAEQLGYTQGILSAHEEPYLGEELHAYNTARWVVGWIRFRDKKIFLKEIYRQDESRILQEAPHKREFFIERDGETVKASGHRYRRGISPNDARFIVNIAELCGSETILDPFAGIGGIVLECRNRNLKIFASELDMVIRPGIACISHNRCAIADARQLPFRDSRFDAIITEPPFDTRYRQSVIDSIPELCRVVKQSGKIILLIAHDMYDQIIENVIRYEFRLVNDFILRRHGKLKSHVLRFDRECCIYHSIK